MDQKRVVLVPVSYPALGRRGWCGIFALVMFLCFCRMDICKSDHALHRLVRLLSFCRMDIFKCEVFFVCNIFNREALSSRYFQSSFFFSPRCTSG